LFTQPVKGQSFYGRTEVLELLDKRIKSLQSGYRQNVALTGNMMCGKSSILYHFLESLKSTDIIPVYIEVCGGKFRDFASRFTATILYSFLKAEGKPLSENLDKLIQDCQPMIPRTIEAVSRIKQLLSSRKFDPAYKQMLELTSLIKEETGKSCVVILDEFHNLDNFKVKNPFLHLGRIIMIQKNTMYIVSSSQKSTIKKILTEKLSLLFGNFEILEIGGFDGATAKKFLLDKCAPLELTGYYADYILDLSDRNPFYLTVISAGLKHYAERVKITRVNVETIKEALLECIFAHAGTLNQHFTNQINFAIDKNKRKPCMAVLMALSRGENKLRDISRVLKMNERQVSEVLDEVIAADMVFKCGVFYKITDRLFEFWLGNVLSLRDGALIGNGIDRAPEFRKRVENHIETYLIEYNRSTPERLKDLFRGFGGEFVENENKLRKFPKFANVEVLKYSSSKNYLVCTASHVKWLCKIVLGRTEESDVAEFLSDFGRLDKMTKRRVLISLGGIDTNALLVAKEKHMWVWDAGRINLLLRLFNKNSINS